MTLPTFQHLMDIVNPSLMKRSPRALEPEQRIALTLRYVHRGALMKSVFGVDECTDSRPSIGL